MKKKTILLGATGSIGGSALDVLRRHRDDFEPVLISAHRRGDELLRIKEEFPGVRTALSGVEYHPGIDYFGKEGLLFAVRNSGADIALNGIAGAAGLEPSLAVLESGMDLCLANKETIVMAGPLVLGLAEKQGVRVIPVDSEHSALFKLIEAHGRERVRELILTASGGPFRDYSMERLKSVGVKEALAHPTWKMGPKITIDSATLANKGLEVIEAGRLFDMPPERIRVTVHPQSIVHSMVRLADGAVYAQLSPPDMRLPIHDALYWPETAPADYGVLDFASRRLDFSLPDPERFPMLALAYEALGGNPLDPVIYNGANEAAVEAFLRGSCGFLEIPRVVGYVLKEGKAGRPLGPPNLEEILEKDQWARDLARDYISKRGA
ncbi:MAG: 1-deoxy-D-xylulose-5-phosphate reductoisomerase [Treponema sp.]|jgi:1-deoxy-D-xylulose-5-phosphate reductoisomerase|nr:1-deoxy-D-xylulose-5-phosphate reductoisomerase [Treponema sp.]